MIFVLRNIVRGMVFIYAIFPVAFLDYMYLYCV